MSLARKEVFAERKEFEVFSDWARCKASLMVPVNNDLSGRMFDCLLAGTIPIVPEFTIDFWNLFSTQEIQELGLISYNINKPESIKDCLEIANKNFKQLGKNGINLRHNYAKEHCLTNRLSTIVRNFSTGFY